MQELRTKEFEIIAKYHLTYGSLMISGEIENS